MIIVLSTYPDRGSAERAADDLVGRGLAACASIIPVERSVYRWKGKIHHASERLLMVKTTKRAYGAVERRIKGTHPHWMPEIIYIDVPRGQSDYLGWVEGSCRLFRVPLERRAIIRAGEPPREDRRARKPSTRSR